MRLRRRDVERLRLREGEAVEIRVRPLARPGPVDLASLPTGRDRDPEASLRHDEYLYGNAP